MVSTDMDSLGNSLLRLSVLFHEARHSDGNGQYAAFPHATCASGDYQGLAACEENLNGPYAVQAILLRYFYSGCTNCTDTEKQGLLLALSDFQSRLQPDAVYHDSRPEGVQ